MRFSRSGFSDSGIGAPSRKCHLRSMPLKYTFSAGSARIAVWKIEESESELWKTIPYSIADAEYLRRISHPRRRIESLAARAALSALQQAYTNSFFSLSHSFPWAAAATAPHPIALDIETRRPFPEKVSDYFTQKPEQETFISQKRTLWHAWCAKEVAYKLLCRDFHQVSFKKELWFDGEQVIFRRGAVERRIGLFFLEGEEWLLAVGSFA